MLSDLLEWSGCDASVAGGMLLVLNNGLSRFGWWCFLVSNALWIGFGFLSGAAGLVVQQAFFVAINVLGLIRWMRPGFFRNVSLLNVCHRGV